jgi:hypothetical protein
MSDDKKIVFRVNTPLTNSLNVPCSLMQADAGKRPSRFFLPPMHGLSRKLRSEAVLPYGILKNISKIPNW